MRREAFCLLRRRKPARWTTPIPLRSTSMSVCYARPRHDRDRGRSSSHRIRRVYGMIPVSYAIRSRATFSSTVNGIAPMVSTRWNCFGSQLAPAFRLASSRRRTHMV